MADLDVPLHLLIATPSYDGNFTLAYTKSLFRLQKYIRQKELNIELSFSSISMPFIEDARNFYAACMLEDVKYSHLLFIDQDHGYPPELIVDMVNFNRPVMGVVYPARTFDFDAFWEASRQSSSAATSKPSAVRFVRPPFVADASGAVTIVDGFARVSKLGTGIMMIRREVFEALAVVPDLMAEDNPDYRQLGLSGRYPLFFRRIIRDDNVAISEDVSFCMRWIELCQGEIWANMTHETSHVGIHEFKGRFLDRLRKG